MQSSNRSARAQSPNDLSTRADTPRNLLGLLPGNTLPFTYPCLYQTNCNFLTLDLYAVVNILSPLTCGNVICGGDSRCTHFTHDPNTNGGTCYIKSVPNSGGGWYTPTPPSTGIICGHIP